MQNVVKGICLQKSLFHGQTHVMSSGIPSLTGIGMNSQPSLGWFSYELKQNSRHRDGKQNMKPCLWTTLGARLHFSRSVLLKHQQWPRFWALVAHWWTHKCSGACFSFVYLHKFPYGMAKTIEEGMEFFNFPCIWGRFFFPCKGPSTHCLIQHQGFSFKWSMCSSTKG